MAETLGDMLITVTTEAFVFYPWKINTQEVGRIPISSINKIEVEDKTTSDTTFASGFIVFSKKYKRFDLVIGYTDTNGRLQERAVFRFRGDQAQVVANQVADTLKKYIH